MSVVMLKIVGCQIITNLLQMGQGCPSREPVVSEEQQKEMMAYYYRKQEEMKVYYDSLL